MPFHISFLLGPALLLAITRPTRAYSLTILEENLLVIAYLAIDEK